MQLQQSQVGVEVTSAIAGSQREHRPRLRSHERNETSTDLGVYLIGFSELGEHTRSGHDTTDWIRGRARAEARARDRSGVPDSVIVTGVFVGRFLRLVGDDRFRGEEQGGDRGCVLECRPRDLGGVDDADLDEILILTRGSVETLVA